MTELNPIPKPVVIPSKTSELNAPFMKTTYLIYVDWEDDDRTDDFVIELADEKKARVFKNMFESMLGLAVRDVRMDVRRYYDKAVK